MMERLRPLAIQQYIKLARLPGVISFAAGLPDLSVLPLRQLKDAYGHMVDETEAMFQYRPPTESLKQKIQGMMEAKSVPCTLDEIFITGGLSRGLL